MNSPARPDFPAELFRARRDAALQALGDGVMVLPAAPVQHASRDTERPYVADRELYYVTGAREPGTVAVLVGGPEPRLVLFVRPRDRDAELWGGVRLGPDGARERLGPDECHPTTELGERLGALLDEGDRIFYRLGRGDAIEREVLEALARARRRGARAGTGPRGVVDPGEVLDGLRLVKGPEEIARLRDAAGVSQAGHRAGAAVLRPGVGEWQVAAAIDGAFRAAGARGPGYETIVACGANACVLHYVANDAAVGAGDLVLVDAGAEMDLYHGDITRTWPASGRFTPVQRDVYDVVEAARAAAVEAVAPGATVAEVHERAVRVLSEGLVVLGVLAGDVDDLVAEGAHREFFPHQTSHWLGLDVHDPGEYARAGASTVLRPGMVLTVEPGLYFRPGAGDAAARLEGLGVRIEDDVVVTDEGREVLTGGLPTAPEDVEELLGALR